MVQPFSKHIGRRPPRPPAPPPAVSLPRMWAGPAMEADCAAHLGQSTGRENTRWERLLLTLKKFAGISWESRVAEGWGWLGDAQSQPVNSRQENRNLSAAATGAWVLSETQRDLEVATGVGEAAFPAPALAQRGRQAEGPARLCWLLRDDDFVLF